MCDTSESLHHDEDLEDESVLPFVQRWADWSQLGEDPIYGSGARAAELCIDLLLKGEQRPADTTDSLDDWVVCHRVNLHFYVIKPQPFICLVCRRQIAPIKGERRSDFLQRVFCPDGHDHHLRTKYDICTSCDSDTILNITKHNQICFKKGCGKKLLIDQTLIEWNLRRVKAQTRVIDAYLHLLRSHNTFDCIACCQSIELGSKHCPDRLWTESCQHDIDICTTCTLHHLRAFIKPKQFTPIRCPTSNCNQLLTTPDIKYFAPPDLLNAYQHSLFLHNLSTDPFFRWCTNPTSESCASGQLHPAADTDPCWTCNKCQFKNCFVCKIPWHTNQTCDQYRLSKKFDGESLAEIKRRTKQCPVRGCGNRIEKNGMCKDMTCKVLSGGVASGCGRKWCWSCKVIYEESVVARGGSQHLDGCEYKGDWRAGVVDRPKVDGKGAYREGWDVDEGYVERERESWAPGVG